MNRVEVLTRLTEILTKNFKVPSQKVDLEATFRGRMGLDSFDVLDFIQHVQKSFGVRSDVDAYRDLHTVGKLVDFLVERTESAHSE